MKTFSYKGFIGSIEADPKAKCLYGRLLYINDLISYEADTVGMLEKEFKNAVNDYFVIQSNH
jgi:predicted HicB family RNase H-like nuclease